MGRRWGKTVLGGCLSVATASQGGRVAWVVPTYKNGRSLWRFVENVVTPVRQSGGCNLNRSERIVEFANGGYLGIYSADNEDSIRGESFHLVILDEAARISPTAWSDAIQPTLADYGGQAFLISTPKGLNWFYEEYMRGLDDMKEVASFTAPSYDNPNPNIQKAFMLAKERVAMRTFQQEWMAQFVADGAYFQKVEQAAVITQQDEPEQHAGHILMMAADFGRSVDFTVLVIGCRDCNRVVAWDRFNQIDYDFQRERCYQMYERWRPMGFLPERNSIGEPNIEIMRERIPILNGPGGLKGFNTMPSTKPALITDFASAIEHDGFLLPKVAADELRAYEVETMDSGHPKFGAPEGMHDDWVMALAILWRALRSGGATAEEWVRALSAGQEAGKDPRALPPRGNWDKPVRFG